MLNRLTRNAPAMAMAFTVSAAGAQDCDLNGTPDSVQIANDPSLDTNSNGVLDGCEQIENITQGTFWAAIEFAIDEADEGDTIVIQPGVYTLQGSGQLEITNKALSISGSNLNDPSVVDATVINPDFGIDIRSTVPNQDLVFRGLTLTTVFVDRYEGGNIIFDRCRFVPSSLDPLSAIFVNNGNMDIVIANTRARGYEQFFELFDRNFAVSVDVVQSLIAGTNGFSVIDEGPGSNQFFLYIQQSTIVCDSQSVMSAPGIMSEFVIDSSIVRGSVTTDASSIVVYGSSNIQGVGGKPGTGVFDADPMFTDPDGADDDPATFADNDYSLLAGSPSIDTGTAFLLLDTYDLDNDGDTIEPLPLDLAGNTRVVDAQVDMGSFEFQGPPPCPADLAAPFGTLNFFDVAAFISLYNAGDPAADFAAPFGTLNFFDVAAFIAAYNAGCP